MQGKASNAPPLSSKSRISIKSRDHRPGTGLVVVVVMMVVVVQVVILVVVFVYHNSCGSNWNAGAEVVLVEENRYY